MGSAAAAAWKAPSLMDLLPDLSAEEKERLLLKGSLPDPERLSPPYPVPCVREGDEDIISTVCDVLDHYNTRHPGGEFDVVKPLVQDRLALKNRVWLHMNFWARSRSSKKIKRFFAEMHYKPCPCQNPPFPCPCITIVESCTILEEPLAQYRRSCACCRGYFDILHPMDARKFVCGTGIRRTG